MPASYPVVRSHCDHSPGGQVFAVRGKLGGVAPGPTAAELTSVEAAIVGATAGKICVEAAIATSAPGIPGPTVDDAALPVMLPGVPDTPTTAARGIPGPLTS